MRESDVNDCGKGECGDYSEKNGDDDEGKEGGVIGRKKRSLNGKAGSGGGGGKVEFVGRILRSASKLECVKSDELDVDASANALTESLDKCTTEMKTDGDDPGVVVKSTVKRKRGRPPKVNVGLEKTETNVDVVTKAIDERESLNMVKADSDDSDVIQVNTVKRKRGRPRKLEAKTVDTEPDVAVVTQIKYRRGRPHMKPGGDLRVDRKKKQDGCMKSKPGFRGMLRQPTTSGKNSKWGMAVDGTQEKSSASNGRKNDSNPDFDVDFKGIDDASVEEKNCDVNLKTAEMTSKTNVVELREKGKEKIGGCGRSMEKHLIREQIKDMLLSAGWTVEYRLRMSKDYSDAVYVSPQGRGYWSVTKAYNVLKNHYENIDEANQKVESGFMFKPIPEDVLNMLTRITIKKKEHLVELGGQSLNQKLKGTERRQKLTLHSSEAQAQKFVLESKFKLSRRKSKSATTNRRRALLVRDSEKGVDGSSTFNLYPGKRMVLNWMIDLSTVPLNMNVHYRGPQQKTRRTHGGRVARDGIYCSCCNEVVTLLEFQAHARGKSDYPSQYIYLEDGRSLLQCQLLTWNKQDDLLRKGFHSLDVTCDDPNDDSCGICGNGGELICCDGCTSAFHIDCLNLPKFPSGEWNCIYCSCKLCGQVCRGASCSDVDEVESLSSSTCRLCGQKYHGLCIQTDHATGGPSEFDFSSFCGTLCQEVLNKLTLLIGVKNKLKDGYSWTVLRRFDVGSDLNISETPLKVECNSKLAVALSIIDECFLPIIDNRTGVNLIHNVIYNCGSNFTRLNYSGFYTVILEKGDELVSAASIRVHGDGLAEMPFIGTRHNYRRQGLCGRLLGAVEDALRLLGVKNLVIPAISELLQMWTSVFGFKPLEVDGRQKLKNVNLLVFPCTDMLQKTILETSKEQEHMIPTDSGCQYEAAGKLDNSDPKSQLELETSSGNAEEGVHQLKMILENYDFNTQPDGLHNHTDHISTKGTLQIAQKLHEGSCINDVSEIAEATLFVPDQIKEASHIQTDSTTSTSFHSADEGFCADHPGEVGGTSKPPKTSTD